MIPADARSGSTVGKYRLHEIVGRGGMGVVYRAEHVYIGREVAVKILHEGYGGREESIKRFLREARAASLINHPNIVEVTDFGKANDGTVFFVMELLVGEPLDNILARDRRLDLLRSITICNQLAAALAAAHAKGIIHRDLKPENVMLIPREGRRELVRRVADESGAYELSEREKRFDFVKILDFGVAKVREAEPQKGRPTRAGVVFGTPEYMAPETARIGYSDARSDVYALGVMFYEMMTGTVPFTGDAPVEVMMKQVNDRVPPMHEVAPEAEVTEEAERMILKALAKDPDHRQQNMEEFHRDLQKCYGQLRFRRTVKTPATSIATVTIPLTRKKKQVPGAIPTSIGSGGSSTSNEIDSGEGGRARTLTPRLPGLALNATAPILLTRKKNTRPPDAVAAPAAAMPARAATTPAAAAAAPAPSGAEVGPARLAATAEVATPRLREVRPEDVPTPKPEPIQAEAEAEQTPPKKKRTTLPLGMEQEAERLAKLSAVAVAPTPEAANETTRERASTPAPALPTIPSRGAHIASVMIAVPKRPVTAAHRTTSPTADRATPRVSVATTGLDETGWFDEPTAPGVKSGGT